MCSETTWYPYQIVMYNTSSHTGTPCWWSAVSCPVTWWRLAAPIRIAEMNWRKPESSPPTFPKISKMRSEHSPVSSVPLGKQARAAANDEGEHEADKPAIKTYTRRTSLKLPEKKSAHMQGSEQSIREITNQAKLTEEKNQLGLWFISWILQAQIVKTCEFIQKEWYAVKNKSRFVVQVSPFPLSAVNSVI